MLQKNTLSSYLIQATREEETMRHIVTLVREVNSYPFYPHIVIWFDEIRKNQLIYSVLLVRKKNGEAIDQIIERIDPTLEFTPERVQHYGDVEVNCFRLKMEIPSHDLSLYPIKARQKIIRALEGGLGSIRDYYGGLLEKKEENLLKLKSCFPEINESFIETFFYSIHPRKVQATLSEETLRDFFSYMLFSLNGEKRHLFHNKHGFFAYCRSNHAEVLLSLKRDFYRKGIDLHSIISVSLKGAEKCHLLRHTGLLILSRSN